MNGINWGEIGRFSIVLLLCVLLVGVPALLLKPMAASIAYERDLKIIRNMSDVPVRGVVEITGLLGIRSLYRLNDGSSVIFFTAGAYTAALDMAMLVDNQQKVKDIVITSLVKPPYTALPGRLISILKSERVLPLLERGTLEFTGAEREVLAGLSPELITVALRNALSAAREAQS